MEHIKFNNLSTTRLVASNNDRYKLIRNLLTNKQELINRFFGKGE